MKLYIAGHNQEDAIAVADALMGHSAHQITARWLKKPFNRTNEHSEEERIAIAEEDHSDITAANGLVLLASPKRVPGGKFVEVGIALGQGKPVYILGHRENMLMWHPSVKRFDSVEDLMKEIG